MCKRIVVVLMPWAILFAMTGGVVSAQDVLSQPLSKYAGPPLKPLTAAAPTNPGDKEYIPTGNLCALMHAWEKATGHELKLGEPIEVPEWRQMVIAGGSTGWVWVPARTQYWEFNGKALFFGPMPDNKDVPKNRGTGCCNPVGEGFIPNPEPVVAQPESQPAPSVVVPPIVTAPEAKSEPIRPLPAVPQPTWRIDHNKVIINTTVVVKKSSWWTRHWYVPVLIVAVAGGGGYAAAHGKGNTTNTTIVNSSCPSCTGGPPSVTPGGPGH